MTETQELLESIKILIELFREHRFSKKSLKDPCLYRAVTADGLIELLRTRGTVKRWEIGRAFRNKFESVLRPLVDAGRVAETRPTKEGRGRRGLLYTWIG